MATHAAHHGLGFPSPRHVWDALVARLRRDEAAPRPRRRRRRAPSLDAVTGNLGDAFMRWSGQG